MIINNLNWFLIGSFLVLSLVIGILAKGHVSQVDDFLLAGRNIRKLWGVATLSSTEMGLVTIVYFSQEAYANGFVALVTALIAAVTMWIIGKTGFVIKKLRELEIRTVPEYFEERYSPGIRLIAGILTFLTGVLNMGIFLQVEGRFLAIILGLPIESLPVIMGILLIFVVIYTILGGMYSVVITDVFQFVLIVVGIVVTSIMAFDQAGGMTGMVEAVRSHYGNNGFDLWKAPHYGLLFVVWTSLYYISGWSSWQPVVQRTLSMKSVKAAGQLFQISSIFMFFRASMPMLWGIAGLAILGSVDDSQTALPIMLVKILPAGVIGLVVIGFLAASMSTYDSYLLSFSSILVQDICGAFYKNNISDKKRILFTRLGILAIAVFIFVWGVYYTFTDTVFRIIALTGSLSYAGIISGLTGGIYWKKANTCGAYIAFALSAIPPVYALFVPSVNPVNAGLFSFILAPVGLILGSFIRKPDIALV